MMLDAHAAKDDEEEVRTPAFLKGYATPRTAVHEPSFSPASRARTSSSATPDAPRPFAPPPPPATPRPAPTTTTAPVAPRPAEAAPVAAPDDAPGLDEDEATQEVALEGELTLDEEKEVARRPRGLPSNLDATALGLDESAPREKRQPPPADLARLDAAIQILKSLGQSLAEQARSDALEIGFIVARQLLRTELTARIEPLLATVKEAVRLAGESRSIRIHLAPGDAERLLNEEHITEIHALSVAALQIVPDDKLETGDVVVETEMGEVDGRLGRRLDALFRAAKTELATGGLREERTWG